MTELIPLPIDGFLPEILTQFQSHQNLVLVAEPGAGKTTRVPPALLQRFSKKILVLEPRRVAAVAAATRIAEETGTILGEDIGYQIRFENKTKDSTRLIFMTEALLSKKIVEDPELKDVDVVILDEFHERSAHVDMALGLLKEAQELGSSIKLLVMSATLEAESISQYLNGAPIVRVPGKSYPLDIRYDKFPQSLRIDENFFRRLQDRLKEALTASTQDILVFLPGVGEINRCQKFLSEKKFSLPLDILHGSLDNQQQRRVLHKSSERRVILSTNIAESSVTIDGVGVVIDCGLNKINSWNSQTGFETLSLQRISQSSATQRAGRAARQGPGLCFRLWNEQDEASMKAHVDPEILRTDLSEAVLWLHFLGVTNPLKFSWYQAPPAHHLTQAKNLLVEIGALKEDGALTEKGLALLKYPLGLRAASVLYESNQDQWGAVGAALAVILQEKDVWSKYYDLQQFQESHENDLLLRYELLQNLKENKGAGFYFSFQKALNQLQKFTKNSRSDSEPEAGRIQKWLLRSFPDRICRRRQNQEGRALMLNGRGVELDSSSIVKKADFFMALQGIDLSDRETKISMAAAVEKSWLENELKSSIESRRELRMDSKSGRIWVESTRYLGKLPLDNPSQSPATEEEIQKLLPQLVQDHWKEILESSPELEQWMKRWKYYVTKKESSTDPLTPELLQQIFQEACYGLQSWTEAKSQNWIYFIEKTIGETITEEFHRFVPSHLKIGSRTMKIQYEVGHDPYIESRIQNFYGLKKHPTIWQGEVSLRLILLGPHGRPIQITKDLPGFWKSSYPEIRKEMKSDYPKHRWPEDPSQEES